MRLVLIALLVLTMAGAAGAADLTKDQGGSDIQMTRTFNYCTGTDDDNGFYQNGIYAYGNALSLGATAGPLTTLDFFHNGYGFSGPYDYTLYVYDAVTCTVIGSIPGLTAADAAAGTIEEIVDLCPYNLVASGDVIVAIHPQSCYVPTDCYPDVEFDYTAPVDGCGSRVEVGVPDTCVQILSSSGVVDFLLGVVFNECVTPPPTGACCVTGTGACTITTEADCAATWLGADVPCNAVTCPPPVPAESVTWGAVKALYR